MWDQRCAYCAIWVQGSTRWRKGLQPNHSPPIYSNVVNHWYKDRRWNSCKMQRSSSRSKTCSFCWRFVHWWLSHRIEDVYGTQFNSIKQEIGILSCRRGKRSNEIGETTNAWRSLEPQNSHIKSTLRLNNLNICFNADVGYANVYRSFIIRFI